MLVDRSYNVSKHLFNLRRLIPRFCTFASSARCTHSTTVGTPKEKSSETSVHYPRPLLRHYYLTVPPRLLLPYHTAADFQQRLRRPFFEWKDSSIDAIFSSKGTSGLKPSQPQSIPPHPALISFSPAPTFTFGRRQPEPTLEQVSRLRAPLQIQNTTLEGRRPVVRRHDGANLSVNSLADVVDILPQIAHTQRGGLTTYHGPGQLVLWPVLDLHSSLHRKLTVRGYARLLEETTRAVLLAQFGIRTTISESDPGVWVSGTGFIVPSNSGTSPSPLPSAVSQPPVRKIAALGVHIRRHITGLGIAINVNMAVTGDDRVNAWNRFVPCGLEGKAVTSVATELNRGRKGYPEATYPNLQTLAEAWANEFATALEIDMVETSVKVLPSDMVEPWEL